MNNDDKTKRSFCFLKFKCSEAKKGVNTVSSWISNFNLKF